MLKNRYNGWTSYSSEKENLRVVICPELGGRIMEFSLDDHNFLFINPNLIGEKNIQATQSWDQTWQNFGGDKIWPAPQGWDGKGEWPGPPDPVLDGGDYSAEILASNSIALTSPRDYHTGLQIERTITLTDEGVSIKTIFKNITEETIKWSIWAVIQVDNNKEQSDMYRIIVPRKKDSIFEKGYKTMHGLVNNPQYKNDGKYFIVDYKYIVGKVGIDSNAGWVAFFDRSCGKVLVVEYDFQAEAEYPDQTPVQIWTQGRGTFYSRNSMRELVNDRAKNPGYSEIELLSPLQDIEPHSEMSFSYKMKACTIPTEMTINDVSQYAVTVEELAVSRKEESVLISACYGFFQKGQVRLVLSCDDEKEILINSMEVTPTKEFNLNQTLESFLLQNVQAVVLEYTNNKGVSHIIEKKIICKI